MTNSVEKYNESWTAYSAGTHRGSNPENLGENAHELWG